MALQSLIARALDNDEYFVLGSLDLSAAFDVVNRELLFKRMETMGMPTNIISLLKDWLDERMFYILLNRLHVLNGKIDKTWLNLSLGSFKIKCKELFLKDI